MTINGKEPELTLGSGFCNQDNNTGTIAVYVAEGATLTNSIGTLEGNYIYGIPDYQTLTVSSTLNGCTAERSVRFTCGAYPYPKCYSSRVDTVSAIAATCSGSTPRNDASIFIDGVYGNRYSYAQS